MKTLEIQQQKRIEITLDRKKNSMMKLENKQVKLNDPK